MKLVMETSIIKSKNEIQKKILISDLVISINATKFGRLKVSKFIT